MFDSFYAKLSALFLVLILGLGVILAVLGVRAAQRYTDEVEQKLNRTLAEELAPRFEPMLRDGIDARGIEATIRDMTGINRRIEIYLLESDGTLKASFAVPDAKIEDRQVDLAPVERFMNGAELPVLGDDPMHAGLQKPFSAAHIEIMGQTGCYLYVILRSAQYASVARMVGDSYIIQTALKGLGIALLVTAGLGLILFRRLTTRLRGMQDVVASFEAGDFEPRMAVSSRDEIGQLAECFNRMADTLVDTLEELRQADKLRRELVANVSHDLRSPLASIQGYLETIHIKDGDLDPAARQQYVETALKNAQRLNHLVGELFELSKLESKQIEPSPEAFPIAELVQDIAMQYRRHAEQEDVALHSRLPDRRTRVRADIGLVERVLSNLIDNAIHYTPPGGRVDVGIEHDVRAASGGWGAEAPADAHVRIFVSDTGPGIPEDDLPHIFERFYRVEKSRTRSSAESGGAGLGLAIAHKIVELHGSRLRVDSTPGEGTTFHFTLPVAEPALAEVSS